MHSLVVAVIEPLEVVVGARIGQKPCDSLAVAVTEPLEAVVRAQFGQKSYDSWLGAVIEPYCKGSERSEVI